MSTLKVRMGSKELVGQYYRLAKPGIIYANVITAIAGYLFAAKLNIDWTVLVGLISGLALLIGGACAYNNYLDRGIDAAMKRTSERSLVTGAIKNWQALSFATVCALTGTALLVLTQNQLTWLLAIVAFVDYVIIYGYTKRHTTAGTLVGCISGAIPLVAGYTAVGGRLDMTAWLLFALMVAWQMGHFYGIALYRLNDYRAAKIPVMPAVHGEKTTRIQTIGYIGAYIAVSLLLVGLGHVGIIAGTILVAAGSWWLYKALSSYRTLSPSAWGKHVFLVSLVVMLSMSALLAVDPLLV